VDLLAKASIDEEAFVRRAAIEELARGWRTDAVQDLLLERAVADDSNDVRYASVMGLGRGWRNERTRKVLLDVVVNDKGNFVRLAAEVHLDALGLMTRKCGACLTASDDNGSQASLEDSSCVRP
jgi:hypothetical protein